MANYNTSANIVLTVNGKQAQKMLSQLEKDAKRLEKGIAKAATAGDKATMKRLQRELNSTKKMMEQLKGTANTVDNTLHRLDKATPKELNRALKTLQQQLNGIQRGTPAWDAHVAKIRMVKAELAKVNATLATQKSLWSRMNGWLNNCQTAIMAVAAAVTGLIMAGRKAVSSYADMEETMANTIKYTRMTAAEVEELNEIFKNMDTRLAREQLNLLAQEGGRLGYNTVASVKEYVEAASIINVALVDLGEGATQTIAKLSNIFGVEEMYGVRDSMLKIGSTVNHLSQNCTAAKPFIVEFAQRMAGIGATAKMTIPEIMAFAATLDANGQKVEMSATALQRTIMALYKKPGEMAKKVGLDANQFIETLNKSTTEGVMVFLDALNKLGESNALAVLSPLFQDLGLDGARVSSVLTNLSAHLDFLKWQMGEASQAFRDGTSASNEYAIFNNTVQASIDKARKRVSELAIELGEKLYPLMKHIYTSSSVFLRVLNKIVTFIIDNRKAIANLITVIAVYYSWIGLVKVATVAWHAVLGAGKAIMVAYRTAIIMGKIVMLAFTQGLGAATHAMRLLNTVVKANPFGLLLSVITAIVLVVKALCDRTSEYTKKMREARNTAANFGAELRKEMETIDTLIGKLKAAEKDTKQYKEIKDEIIKQYGKYLKGLINERGEITNLTAAYNRLAAAARIAAKERSIQMARDTANETYDDAMKEWAKKLQKSLMDEGKSLQDAVRITNRVVYELQTTGTLNANLVAELQAIKGNLWDSKGWTDHPVNLVNEMIGGTTEYNTTMADIDNLEREQNPLASYPESELRRFVRDNQSLVDNNQGGRILIGLNAENPEIRTVSAAELKELFSEAQARLSVMETPSTDIVGGNPDFNLDDYTPYETEKEKREREAAERRAAIKAKKEFKDELNNAKGDWEAGDAANITDFTNSKKSWTQFLLDKHNLEIKYYEDRMAIYEKYNLQEDENYQELLKKKAECEQEWLKKNAALKVEEAKRLQKAEETQAQMDFATPGNVLYQNEEALQLKLFEIKMRYLRQMQAAYQNTSEEWHNYQVQIEQAEGAEQLRRQQRYAKAIAEWKKQYAYQEAGARLKLESDLLEEIHQKGLISEEEYQRAKADLKKKYAVEYMPDSAKPDSGSKEQQAIAMKRDLDIIKSLYDQGIIDKKQYEEAKARIEKNYRKKSLDAVRKFGSTETNQLLDIYEAWKNFFDKTEEDGGNWATRLASLASSVFAVMSAGMQQASEFIQAEADLEVAKAEKKYDREIELAEGNSYKVKKAEKAKEKEIAKIKSDAAKKQFAMQVIQAVAQTATNALNAYGSAAQVPVIGYILAPIAAAMAVAAGAIQIATIKKQQQASEAQGYMTGGFTPEGNADEVAGVVHKGEWVASQRLTQNPQTRPLLEALDYAQRTNTIGSIKMSDVSRTITAPAVLAAQSSAAPTVVNNTYVQPSTADNSELTSTIRELRDAISEPLGAIVTVSGDYGIEKAKSDYDKLMRNKSPKSKR